MSINANRLLRHRSVWIGCAMIWIAMAHSGLSFFSPFLSCFQQWGYGGVDICLFASGIGCYVSLSKNPDLPQFVKRRLSRLSPTYLCFMAFWLPCQIIWGRMSLPCVLGNLFGIQQLTGLPGSFNWYISALLVLYILAPYLKILADLSANRKTQLLSFAVISALTIPFWTSGGLIIIAARVPVFFLGMLFAKACQAQAVLRLPHILLSVAGLLLGIAGLYYAQLFCQELLWSHGLYWYPFLLIAPNFCILASLAAEALDRFSPGRRILGVLSKIGTYSFEIYLCHIPFYEALSPAISARTFPIPKNVVWLCTVPAVVLMCVLLRHITTFCTKHLFRPHTPS